MIQIRRDVSLLPYNTFGVSATAAVFVESDQTDDIVDFFRTMPDPASAFVLGGGSNVLLTSERYQHVIRPVMTSVELIDETAEQVIVRVGAGADWDKFVGWCVDRQYAGVENLSQIPGTVGACPIQNIGAYSVEAKETIEAVETIEISTGRIVTFNNRQCSFDYRDSFFKRNKGQYLITAVQFKLSKKFVPNVKYADLQSELPPNEPITLQTIRRAVINLRSRKLPDPTELGNAGSFFKNPAIDPEKYNTISRNHPQAPLYPLSDGFWKISAAWLIQQCGWKGVREGAVGVYSQQPLVIVNYGGANAQEILNFAHKIIDSVNNRFGIVLEPEVNVV